MRYTNRLDQRCVQPYCFFHAFTGCDTVSSFEQHGKKSAWNVWANTPEVTATFIALSTPLAEINEHHQQSLEKFVSKWYCKDLDAINLDDARKNMVFQKAFQSHELPPTAAALKYHSLRALYQGGHVWGKALVAQQNLEDPRKFGWVKKRYFCATLDTLTASNTIGYEQKLWLQNIMQT